MSIELSADQLQAAMRGPVHITDPETNQSYVVLRADVYEQMAYCDDDFDPREAYPFIDRVMAEDDANDPYLESYQDDRQQP